MPHVEQAIFTSAETDRSAGYQVVARSPGVTDVDARELRIWGPSHDSLLELGPDAVSFNFHRLPSGAYSVSRTTPAGWEYSGRGGHRVYTQSLIVPSEVLERFANNPFALIRAAQAGGVFEIHDQLPRQLEPLDFPGKAAPVDQTLLTRLASTPGPRALATLIQAALDSACLAFAGPPSPGELIAGLFSCLPPSCRPEFSFCTGLKYSSRRPFRIVALSGDPTEQRWVAHQTGVTMLELSDDLPADSQPIDGWAQFVKRVMSSGRTSFLATQLSKRRSHLAAADLPALGLQLLEDFDASALRKDHENDAHCCQDPKSCEAAGPAVPPEASQSDGLQRAHAAHRRFLSGGDAATAEKLKSAAPSKMPPSKILGANSPQILGKLEQLDDLVFEAISGQSTSLQQLETLWPEVLDELGDEAVAESREQYLRYALRIWEDCVGSGAVHNPARAVQALDVLCLLFNEV